jgi:hypothetical protein
VHTGPLSCYVRLTHLIENVARHTQLKPVTVLHRHPASTQHNREGAQGDEAVEMVATGALAMHEKVSVCTRSHTLNQA